ncbi:hypothetical protein M8J77_009345 [Diaphorina citri]|nr:hypothetical protein M8J77_009345 [Diaphorina citri]
MDRFHPYRLSYSHVARSNIDRRVSRTRSRGGQGWRGRLQGRSFHIPGQRYEQGDYHRAGQGYQAYEEQELVYRGQGVARRGQGVARRGQGVARRGQGVARRGQGVVQQGQGVARRGQGVARGGQGVARGGQGVARRGQGVARRGQGVARRGQGVARQGQGVARRGQGVVGRGRGARRSRVSSGQVNRRIPKTAVEAFHILFGKGKVRKTLDVDVDSNIKVVLKADGNTPEDSDLLKRIDKGSERIDEHSLKINGGTLSGPEENFDGKEDKALQTSVSESCISPKSITS